MSTSIQQNATTSVIQSINSTYSPNKSSKKLANNEQFFKCDVCEKPFRKKEHLFQHRKLHSGTLHIPALCFFSIGQIFIDICLQVNDLTYAEAAENRLAEKSICLGTHWHIPVKKHIPVTSAVKHSVVKIICTSIEKHMESPAHMNAKFVVRKEYLHRLTYFIEYYSKN